MNMGQERIWEEEGRRSATVAPATDGSPKERKKEYFE